MLLEADEVTYFPLWKISLRAQTVVALLLHNNEAGLIKNIQKLNRITWKFGLQSFFAPLHQVTSNLKQLHVALVFLFQLFRTELTGS